MMTKPITKEIDIEDTFSVPGGGPGAVWPCLGEGPKRVWRSWHRHSLARHGQNCRWKNPNTHTEIEHTHTHTHTNRERERERERDIEHTHTHTHREREREIEHTHTQTQR